MFPTKTGNNLTHLFVRSNIHMANLDLALRKHLHLQKYVDVTLSCDGRTFKCHRLILAAASPLFENLLNDSSAQHPIVIMPLGIKAWTMQALIDFMYKGQVNVSQYGLRELVRSGELLQISGLDTAYKNLADFCYKDTELENDNDSEYDNTKNKPKKLRKRRNAYIEPDDSEDATEKDIHQDVNASVSYDMIGDVINEGFYDNDDNNDNDADKTDSYNNNDIVAEAVSDSVGSTGEQQVPDVSYRFEIANESSDTIDDEMNGQQSRAAATYKPEEEVNDADNIFLDEHNDSGLPHSPPTTVCNNMNSALNSAVEGIVGKIRVKPGIKLFDKTTTATKVNDKNSTSSITPPFHIKTEEISFDAERFICEPSVSALCNVLGQVTHDQRTVNDAPDAFKINNSSNYEHSELLKAMLTQDTLPSKSCANDYEEHMSLLSGSVQPIGPVSKRNSKINKLYYSKYSARKVQSKALATQTTRLRNNNSYSIDEELSLKTVILRNPRSNQPRSYSNEALYNALMAVKNGESIYRASREYQVPRKTLRNWMKRWDIKSQFPMPKQLKEAAYKKKLGDPRH